MDNVLHLITPAGGVMCFVLAVGQLFIKEKNSNNYIFAVSFMFISIGLFAVTLLFSDYIFIYPELFFPKFTIFYFLGASGYIFLTMSYRTKPFQTKWFIFYFPVIIVFLFDVYYLFLPQAEKVRVLKYYFFLGTYQDSVLFDLFILGISIHNTSYLGFALFNLIKMYKDGVNMVSPKVYIFYTSLAILISNCYPVCFFFFRDFNVYICKIAAVSVSCLVIGIYLIIHRHPEFTGISKIMISDGSYKRSYLTGIETKKLSLQIAALMEENKLFRMPDISLNTLAAELSIKSYQLSQFLNEQLDTNFYNYINSYRIKEAQKMLLADPKQTIISIAYAVGFNSKSSFNTAFSRFAGESPSSFRSKKLRNFAESNN